MSFPCRMLAWPLTTRFTGAVLANTRRILVETVLYALMIIRTTSLNTQNLLLMNVFVRSIQPYWRSINHNGLDNRHAR